jgi:hypothetical protein
MVTFSLTNAYFSVSPHLFFQENYARISHLHLSCPSLGYSLRDGLEAGCGGASHDLDVPLKSFLSQIILLF